MQWQELSTDKILASLLPGSGLCLGLIGELMRIRCRSSSDQFLFVPLTATEAQVKVQFGEKAKVWMQGLRAASECIVCGDDDLGCDLQQHPDSTIRSA